MCPKIFTKLCNDICHFNEFTTVHTNQFIAIVQVLYDSSYIHVNDD
jgi:hypothetical protein